jgi:hypothetical protein
MPQPRRRHLFAKFLLVLLVTAAGLAAFWFGLVPQKWSPFSPLRLDVPGQWFIDARLAALRFDSTQCQTALKSPHIEASPIADNPVHDRCGWSNAVRFSQAGGVKISVDKLSCEAAAALALWLEYDVQPASAAVFGKRVASVQHMGTYSCRKIIGSTMWKNMPSQHATANAIDIAGFTLEDGTRISVERDWKGGGKPAEFLRTIHQAACRLFRVALSPEFNQAHHDHFHLDRGILMRCK